jgi:hypothetical protein
MRTNRKRIADFPIFATNEFALAVMASHGGHLFFKTEDKRRFVARFEDASQRFFVRELTVERVAMHPTLTTDKTR